ncbi:hypothetical protein [Streptomyces tanashiensis]|uniref:hypothetical protein n=1 Tax=Streptomyces tanashiensis TaxID=67367 RepID=UPI0019A922B9|nr:hypothetical protein [Streptomyces tanashiensis]GGY42579.1 hypothetical protein GCM10010299_56090 [Streptomyces tanashiensis]
MEDGAGLLGEAAVGGHVQRAAQVPGRALLRVACVHHDRAGGPQPGELGERRRAGAELP